MKGLILAVTLALSVNFSIAYAEDDIRDFYAEPGMNLFNTTAGQDATEIIDPFS